MNFDVLPGNISNHSHRTMIRYNPSYGIFFINVLSLRKLDSLRTTAMEYFLYSGSSCKDKQTLPCTIFLYHRKTSYTYLPAKERCIMIHQKLHIRTIFILVPRTQFNVTVLMACIPCMWFHLQDTQKGEMAIWMFVFRETTFQTNTTKIFIHRIQNLNRIIKH